MEDRRAEADKRRRAEHHREAARPRQQEHAEQRESHPRGERVRPRVPIRKEADEGLEQRTGELQHEGDEADLREIELEVLLEYGIDRRNQRLHHVVEQMAEAERDEYLEGGVH